MRQTGIKPNQPCFETGLGCTTTSAFEDMRLNTLRWHKETGVQGYHLVQSFAEGEVTPELAHQIGVEFAEQLLLGKYQAIVTTHLNTKHYHNHIVWSAVSWRMERSTTAIVKVTIPKYAHFRMHSAKGMDFPSLKHRNRCEESGNMKSGGLRKTTNPHGALPSGRMWTKQFNKALHGGSS